METTILVSPNEAARRLGVSAQTIRKWLREPSKYQLRKVKLSYRAIGIPSDDIYALIRRLTVQAAPVGTQAKATKRAGATA
jgi:transposase-like protein